MPTIPGDGSGRNLDTPPFTKTHLDDLARSGISPEFATKNGMYSADEIEVQRLLGRKSPVGPGLVIPYPDPATDGFIQRTFGNNGSTEKTNFLRVRLDDPTKARNGEGEPAKYLSRAGSGQEPYIVPAVAAAIRRGTPYIILTEGEKKALGAAAQGFAAIGLSGNYGWKVKDKHELLPLLADYLPSGVTVVVIWDSDAALNPGFVASTRMLHDALRRRGILMKVVVLPAEGNSKVGLDDFRVAHGPDALKRILDETPVLPSDRQVSAPELLLPWTESMAPALSALSGGDRDRFLMASFRRGLIDRIDHATRCAVLKRMSEMAGADVAALFRTAVEDYLRQKHGALNAPPTASTIQAGAKAKMPDSSVVRVVAVEETFAWITNTRGDAVSWPVPLSLLELAPHQGGSEETPAQLADEFLRNHYTQDEELRLHCYRGGFYEWDGCSYRELKDDDIDAAVMGFLRKKRPALALPKVASAVVANLKAAGVCHIPSSIEPPCRIAGQAFDPAPTKICFSNGSLDVEALARGEDDEAVFAPPTPRLFALNGRAYPFDENADCPRWKEFLAEVLPDAEVRGLVQEMFGYCLIPDTSYQRFFVPNGPGSNGKGVSTDVLAAVVGMGNVCSVSMARFGERFALWPLTTRLVNLVAEAPSVDGSGPLRIAEDKLKSIVSGDPIEVERKNKDIYTARPTARLVFSCNELPPFVDRSNGVWRRMIVIPFNVVVPPERQDPGLDARIIGTELSGVFNWALEGLLRLRRRGRFEEPAACRESKLRHRLTCLSEESFITEHIDAGKPSDFLVIGDVYAAYRSQMAAGGQNPVGIRRFVDALRRLFPSCTEDRRPVPGQGRQRGYGGLQFHPDGIVENEEAVR